MIACLGWGSLIWDPRNLPLQGPWRTDGPAIRAEYLRRSSRNRVTLVLHETGPQLTSLWNIMPVLNWEIAKQHLAVREGVENQPQRIAHWAPGEPQANAIQGLQQWAEEKQVTHVLWTALPPRWHRVDGMVPSEAEVMGFWAGLTPETRLAAEEYVRRTPAQIVTPFRTRAEQQLGWTPRLV
jgi:hypothetical protein